jgi:hypothetical protein
MATTRRKTASARWQGAVIVDVVFEDGLLFLAVQNIGDAPARRVSVRFDRALPGAGGLRGRSGAAAQCGRRA